MIKTYDGTSFKRVGGRPGDRTPTLGIKRDRAVYVATGGETSIDLASLSPAISYFPGNAQISVSRSIGGRLIAGLDFYELSGSSIGFPATDPLEAGEWVEIIKEVSIQGVAALPARLDSYTATATAGQTLVTADFSWAYNLNSSKGVGAIRVVLNGIDQTRGIDYNEVQQGSLANTNQIQFVDALIGGENIQILPLYQALDTSAAATTYNNAQLSNTQGMLGAGTQGFIDQSATIAVPATTIVNRARIPNIAQDLRASFGIERIAVQQIMELQNEFGPNGERVFGALNDDRGLIRLVGSWSVILGAQGPVPYSSNLNDFVEISFYGTGLNLLTLTGSAVRDWRVSVDGGAESAYGTTASNSSVINDRNYPTNSILNVSTGLALGLHTIKIRLNSGDIRVHGFEILNATASNTSINVNPGTAYLAGQKYQLSSAASSTYNSGFTNTYGTAGTRGGRVLMYLASDGTVKKDIQYTNTATAYLTSADHANEEVVRTYGWREFGAGRTDDFSAASPSGYGSFAFTLDDGSTSLAGGSSIGVTTIGGSEILYLNTTSSFITFTFVGTGVDIIRIDSGSTIDPHTVYVDGVVAGTISSSVTTLNNFKIASGLPYGTHTLKISRNSTGNSTICFRGFRVYGPKKPALPVGATEIADYNLMADFSGSPNTSTAESLQLSTGVLRKVPGREFVYSGSGWSVGSINAAYPGGHAVLTPTNTDYVQYTFFGTGFECSASWASTPNTATLTVDGSLYTGAATAKSSSGASTWTPGTSTWLISGPSGARLQVTGLSLGIHTVRLTKSSATDYILNMALDIITPIHSPKSNLYADLQNTLPVGSCALSDNRKTSMIKEALSAQKAWAQAVGVTSNPTTSSASLIPMPDMGVTIKVSKPTKLEINFNQRLEVPSGHASACNIYVNGVNTGINNSVYNVTGVMMYSPIGLSAIIPVAEGVHKVDIYWACATGGTVTGSVTCRTLTVKEL